MHKRIENMHAVCTNNGKYAEKYAGKCVNSPSDLLLRQGYSTQILITRYEDILLEIFEQ